MSMTKNTTDTLKPKDELAGLTATDCCDGCCETRCVITGVGICAHPLKSGLQAPFMGKPETVKLYHRAKKILAHAKIDLRNS